MITKVESSAVTTAMKYHGFGDAIVVAMTPDIFDALNAACQLAFDDPNVEESSGGIVSNAAATECWDFFVKKISTPSVA